MYLIIAIIVLLLIFVIWNQRKCNNFLNGMWVGESLFMEKAGLSEFILYIRQTKNGVADGYILMRDTDGEIIANDIIKLSYNTCYWSTTKSLFKKTDSISSGVKITPVAQLKDVNKMTFSIMNGSLALYNKTKLFAFLYKDTAATAIGSTI
jgi:hypothetical protein